MQIFEGQTDGRIVSIVQRRHMCEVKRGQTVLQNGCSCEKIIQMSIVLIWHMCKIFSLSTEKRVQLCKKKQIKESCNFSFNLKVVVIPSGGLPSCSNPTHTTTSGITRKG